VAVIPVKVEAPLPIRPSGKLTPGVDILIGSIHPYNYLVRTLNLTEDQVVILRYALAFADIFLASKDTNLTPEQILLDQACIHEIKTMLNAPAEVGWVATTQRGQASSGRMVA
jgi:hypothetical protein